MDKSYLLDSSRVVRRTQCPKCRAEGKDTKRDNLAIYSDGHKWCFGGHGLVSKAHNWEATVNTIAAPLPNKVSEHSHLDWPADYVPLGVTTLGIGALKWLRQYGVTDNEIKQWKLGWSASRECLVIPVFDPEGSLLMWQGRFFGSSQKKYLTHGYKSDILHQVGKQSNVLIVTEDFVSALKVGRCYAAAPLWGVSMSHQQVLRAAMTFKTLGIWLDPDKTVEAVKIALRASQYIPSFVVTSARDPKEYSDETIRELVESASYELLHKDKLTRDTDKEPLPYDDPNCPKFDQEDVEAARRVGERINALFTIPKDQTIYACGTCTLSGTREALNHYGKICKKDVCLQRDMPESTKPYHEYKKHNYGS